VLRTPEELRNYWPTLKREATEASLWDLHALPIDNHLAVNTAIMIPTAVPSAIAIVVTTDNHRTAFAVNSSKPAIMVAVPKPHIDILCERGDCDAQSHNRRNDTKTAPHCTISLFQCRLEGRHSAAQCSIMRKVPSNNPQQLAFAI
jgi:hypothetical protein